MKGSFKIQKYQKLISNFSWLTILEIFILVAPLLTYPYLVRVLGRELYGWVITGQITASYCTVLIDFGFKRISARHIAINSKDNIKLGEIISAILILRSVLWVVSFIIYIIVVWCIIPYRDHFILFLFSFLTTISSVLFLDFYFQGIENMKYITIINITVRGLFVAATFILIKKASDYIYVPLLWSIGYIIGGMISLGIVFWSHKISFILPSRIVLKKHLKEGSVIFISDVLITIKDKLNYNIMGAIIGMSDIVVYDIGSRINNLLLKPVTILNTVLFPKMAKKPSIENSKKALYFIFIISTCLVIGVNVFLPWIVKLFIEEDIDLTAIRLYTISPIILGLSSFVAINILYAFHKEKLVLKSSYITSICYVILLIIMYVVGFLKSVLAFVILTVSAYAIELFYRVFLCRNVSKSNKD